MPQSCLGKCVLGCLVARIWCFRAWGNWWHCIIFLPLGFGQRYFVGYLEPLKKGDWSHHDCIWILSQDTGFTSEEECKVSTYSSAKVTTIDTAGQTWIKVCDSIWSTDWLILMYLTATVHIAASCQIPMGHGERRSKREKKQTINNIY